MAKRFRNGDAVVSLETALIPQIKGAAELHLVLMRAFWADNALDVFCIDPRGFTRLAIEVEHARMIAVVHPCNVSKVLLNKKLFAVLMPFAWKIYYCINWAKKTIFRQLEDAMAVRVNAVVAHTGRQYAFRRDMPPGYFDRDDSD